MRIRILFIYLVSIVSLAFLFSFNSAASDSGGVVPNLLHLSKKYNQILYAAFYSLPETKETFLSVVSEEVNSAIFPSVNMNRILTNEKKKTLIDKVTHHLNKKDKDYQEKTIKRLGYWCALSSFFEGLLEYNLISEEIFMEAMFSAPATKGLFKGYTRGQPINKISPEFIGATLSSSERARIYSAVLNKISGLGEKEQLDYLSIILNYFKKI